MCTYENRMIRYPDLKFNSFVYLYDTSDSFWSTFLSSSNSEKLWELMILESKELWPCQALETGYKWGPCNLSLFYWCRIYEGGIQQFCSNKPSSFRITGLSRLSSTQNICRVIRSFTLTGSPYPLTHHKKLNVSQSQVAPNCLVKIFLLIKGILF